MPSRTATARNRPEAPTPAPAAKADAPKFDFASLTVESAPVPAATRKTKVAGPNPLLPPMRASLESNYAGKAITLPTVNAKDAVYLIRAASNELGCGSKVVLTKHDNGSTTINFAAAKRRARKTKAEKAAEEAAKAAAKTDVATDATGAVEGTSDAPTDAPAVAPTV